MEDKDTATRVVAIVGSNRANLSDTLGKLLATHKIMIIETSELPDKRLSLVVLEVGNEQMLNEAIHNSKPLPRSAVRILERNLKKNCITSK